MALWMALAAGTKFGPYEILSKIGAGGMGEVYRARDTRLERSVAIKVLPSECSSQDELRKRLERESRVLSTLAHPHICSLYDVGEQDGVAFLVMEYLEGETLSQRLLRGALPTRQVLQFGIEIADALERAHRRGIVHRDLKPGNIMLTKDGAKLLDFGLARMESSEPPSNDTVTALSQDRHTLPEKGLVLGTFQYMAPEQLGGDEANARTDIFALGAVIYEMATGKPAFSGTNRTSLIAAILTSEPPAMTSLQPLAPPALERIVKTCLEKDPDARWQSAQDLKLQLQWIIEGGSQAGLPKPVSLRRYKRETIAWILLVFMTVVAAALAIGFLKRAPQPAQRISIALNPPTGLVFPNQMAFAISPDGRQVAFIPSDSQIWIQKLDEFAPKKLSGTDGSDYLVWSPDNRSIVFHSNNKLRRFDLASDRSKILCDSDTTAVTLNHDGLALTGAVNHPITSFQLEDCKQRPATKLDAQNEFGHIYPSFLPDGRRFLYLIMSRGTDAQVATPALYMGALDSGERHLLLQKASNAQYVSPGYIIFASEGDLTAQAIDLKRMQVRGEPLPLRESRVAHSESSASVSFSVSENGVLVYQPEVATINQLNWVGRTGNRSGELIPHGVFQRFRLSTEGNSLLVARLEPGTHRADFWKFDIHRQIWTRITAHSTPGGGWAVFSPNARRIAFVYRKSGTQNLYLKDADDTLSEKLLLESPNFIIPCDWSSDGRFVLYVVDNKLSVVATEDGKNQQIADDIYYDDARFSPNGHSVAFVSQRSGRPEVYLQAFPGRGPARQVSGAGGVSPKWSHDGKEIFFLSPDRKMMAVRVTPDLQTETAKPLFDLNADPDDIEYEVASDGHFLMLTSVDQTAGPLRVVMNWKADLAH
jgi:serine/threonine protein kinase